MEGNNEYDDQLKKKKIYKLTFKYEKPAKHRNIIHDPIRATFVWIPCAAGEARLAALGRRAEEPAAPAHEI